MEQRERSIDPFEVARKTLGESAEIVAALVPERVLEISKEMAVHQLSTVLRLIILKRYYNGEK